MRRVFLGAACAAVLWGAAAKAAIVKGPYLQKGSAKSISVVWETDVPTRGDLRVCLPGSACQFIPGGEATLHTVSVTDLEPDSRYQYTVIVPDQALGPYEFATAPVDAGEPFTFLVYGDNRNDVGGAHQSLVEAMHLESSDFILQTGDLVATGGDEADWVTFFQIEKDLLRENVIWPALGNHELLNEGLPIYRKYFDVPHNSPEPERYYSFRYAGAFFVSLDGNQPASEVQRAWLDHELQAARADSSVDHIFVQVHQPVYSTGAHGGSVDAQGLWVPLFERAGVTAVFQGHDHLYERLQKGTVSYFVSGGGGGPLYAQRADALDMPFSVTLESAHHFLRVRVFGDEAEVRAIRVDGSEIERVVIHRMTGASPQDLPDSEPATPKAHAVATTVAACAVKAGGAKCGRETQIVLALLSAGGALARARGRRRELVSACRLSCRAE